MATATMINPIPVDDGISYRDEFYSTEGVDAKYIEYVRQKLRESEDDPRPTISLDELKKKHREKYGYGLLN